MLGQQSVPVSALQSGLQLALPLWDHPLAPRWWDQPSVLVTVPTLAQQSGPVWALQSELRSAPPLWGHPLVPRWWDQSSVPASVLTSELWSEP